MVRVQMLLAKMLFGYRGLVARLREKETDERGGVTIEQLALFAIIALPIIIVILIYRNQIFGKIKEALESMGILSETTYGETTW